MKYLFVSVLATITPTTVYAYLDPGTGSILIQALIAGFAVVSLFFSNARLWIAEKLFRRKQKDKQDEEENS